MSKYTAFRPVRGSLAKGHIAEVAKKAAAKRFFPAHGYIELTRDHPMRNHLEDWMVPVSSYPPGVWVPVWLLLLWEIAGGSPGQWRGLVREYRGDTRKMTTLMVSELLKRKGSNQENVFTAINSCLALVRQGRT